MTVYWLNAKGHRRIIYFNRLVSDSLIHLTGSKYSLFDKFHELNYLLVKFKFEEIESAMEVIIDSIAN